jgi:hypothetical protein
MQFASQTANRTQDRVAPSPTEEYTTVGYLVTLDDPILPPTSKSASGGKSIGKKGAWPDDAQ